MSTYTQPFHNKTIPKAIIRLKRSKPAMLWTLAAADFFLFVDLEGGPGTPGSTEALGPASSSALVDV
jgi:hypothetical protein